MSQEVPCNRVYRLSGRRFGLICLCMGAGTLALVAKVSGEPYWSGAVKASILVPGLLIIGLFCVLAFRSATMTDAAKITVQGLLRRRSVAWPDVRDICSEMNIGAYASRRAPKQIAVLYHLSGRRIPLPNINDKNLAELHTSLDRELEAIREIWARQRGPQWVPQAVGVGISSMDR